MSAGTEATLATSTSESVWANRVQCISDGASGGSVYTRLVAAMNPYPSQVAQQRDCRLPFVDLVYVYYIDDYHHY